MTVQRKEELILVIHEIRNVDGALPTAPQPLNRDIRLGFSTEKHLSTKPPPLHTAQKIGANEPSKRFPSCMRSYAIIFVYRYVRSNKRFHKLFARQTTIECVEDGGRWWEGIGRNEIRQTLWSSIVRQHCWLAIIQLPRFMGLPRRLTFCRAGGGETAGFESTFENSDSSERSNEQVFRVYEVTQLLNSKFHRLEYVLYC